MRVADLSMLLDSWLVRLATPPLLPGRKGNWTGPGTGNGTFVQACLVLTLSCLHVPGHDLQYQAQYYWDRGHV